MPALALLCRGGSEGHNKSKAKHESLVGGCLHGKIYEPNYSLQDKWSDFCFFKACESLAEMSCSALNFQKDVAQLDGVQWKATQIVRGLENMTCEERAWELGPHNWEVGGLGKGSHGKSSSGGGLQLVLWWKE